MKWSSQILAYIGLVKYIFVMQKNGQKHNYVMEYIKEENLNI